MPIHVYPSENIRDFETASRRVFSGNCSSPGSMTTPETASNLKKVRTRTAVGWRTPGWRKLMNSGAILPFTKWEKFSFDLDVQLGHREWCSSSSANRQRWDNYYRGGSLLDKTESDLLALVDPYDLEYMVQKAAAKISSSGWDALTFIAEINQLRRMLTGVGRKLDFLTGKRGLTPSQLLDLWLEGRYGWRTLLYDIRDLHGALKSANDRRTRYRQASGDSVSGSYNDYTESTSSGIITGFSTDINWSGSLRGTVVADIDVPDFQFNPVTTAWEITRLSFVVDWLINVGQALEVATFLLMAKSYRAGGGIKFDFNLSLAVDHVGTTGSTIVHANDGSASGTAQVIKRLPMPVSVLPRVKLRLDGYKIVDLLALVRQRLSKRR